MTDREFDPTTIADAGELLDRFLTDRNDRTLQAYTSDLDDFARFQGTTPAVATARLLAAGPGAAWHLALRYGTHLRRLGRAPATIERHLNTLRALVRDASDHGLVGWQLGLPTDAEISASMGSVPARDNEHYLFPRHLGEIDRLDIQHYALRETLRADFLAPVDQPARILDVGSGTGQWGYDMCRLFDQALVVGLDLVPGKPDQPTGYRYVRGNLLQGLPFVDGRFDFVHQRLLTAGLPVSSWPGVVAELSRVTRPGGWVELVEIRLEGEPPGQAQRRLKDLTNTLLTTLDLDTTDVVYRSLDSYLKQAGLANVVRRDVPVPVGRWGGAVGSLMVTNIRAGTTRILETLLARGMVSDEDARAILHDAVDEWENGRMAYPAAVAYGQKRAAGEAPPRPASGPA